MPHYWMIILSAFFIDITFGYPNWLYQRIRHPVVWMGACISFLERNCNRAGKTDISRYVAGVSTMAILLAITAGLSLAIRAFGGNVAETLAIASLLACRSLYDHVYDVFDALRHQGIDNARIKVGYIVGRDVENLDESGVCRAAIESLAESFSDGVVAPLFWAVCFGLPGIACYKAINTADSMIGHKTERYLAFGWAAARLDDVANLIPARISGLLIATAALSLDSIRFMLRYAYDHASPNAGWPEAAMAGALRVQLGGENFYDGVEHASALIGEGETNLTISHLHKAIRVYTNACALLWFMLLLALIAQ